MKMRKRGQKSAMMKKKDDEMERSQSEKFRKAARDLGTDESEEAFDRAVKRIAKKPSSKESKSS